MDKLKRQVLVLVLCLGAAIAARVYFNRVADQIAKDAEPPPSAPADPESIASGVTVVAPTSVDNPPREAAEDEVPVPGPVAKASGD